MTEVVPRSELDIKHYFATRTSSTPSVPPQNVAIETEEAQSVHIKTYAQEWFHNVAEPKQIERTNELEGQHEQGLATRLYYACLQTFRELCRDAAQATSAHTQQSLPSISRGPVRLLSQIGNGGRFVCHDCDRPFATKNDLIAHPCSRGKIRMKGPFQEIPQRHPGHSPPTVTSTALSKRRVSQIRHIADPQALSDQLCTKSVARDQMARIFLWGEGFSDGRLDKALDQSDELRNTVLELLCDFAVELQKKKWLQQSSPHPAYLTEVAKEMNLLVEQSRTVIARDTLETVRGHEDGASTISSISSPNKSSESDAPEVGHNLDSIIQSLMDLASTIENNLIQVERKDLAAKHTNVSTFNVSQPAQIYVSHVRDKFINSSGRNPIYVCMEPGCDYISNLHYDLKRHATAKHKSKQQHYEDVKTVDCPYGGCGCKGIRGFLRTDHLRDHCRRYHRRELPTSLGGTGENYVQPKESKKH